MSRRAPGKSPIVGVRGCAILLACLGVALTLEVVASSATLTTSFAAARNYAVGRGPISVAIVDLNGDGKADLATANWRAKTISILLNRGDGSFEPKRDLAIAGAGGFAVGDLNGDGRPDLATANSGTPITVSVFLNGGGNFEPKRDYPGRSKGTPDGLSIGDFNADGKPDLVSADDGNRVSVFLNKGDASFLVKGDYRAGVSLSSVATGDLNGDGRSDLVTGNTLGANTVSVVLNRGDGSFLAPRDYRASSEGDPDWVAVGDLNGDGKPDVATANDDDTVSVFLNGGGGSLRARREYKTGLGADSVAIADLNGDGKPDLATANFTGTVSVLENNGGGRFQSGLNYRAPGKIPVAIAIGDPNADGRRDLVAANRDSNTVSVLINTPGLCVAQSVRGKTLLAAKRTLARASCSVGTIRRTYSGWASKGLVISQKPTPGTVLGKGGKVNLVVSRGRNS